MLSEVQFYEYKRFYDFSMELFNSAQKIDNTSSVFRLSTKDGPAYNNYFEPKGNEKAKKH